MPRNCPQCDESISENARKCNHCLSDLRPPTLGERIIALRDYVTFPTAVIALVVALYDPIAGSLRAWLSLDHADVYGHVLNPDILNVGADDRPPEQRVETVTEHENLLRVMLTNEGHSLASVLSYFRCTGQRNRDLRMVYIFDYYDPYEQIKQYPSIPAGGTIAPFGRLFDWRAYPLSEQGGRVCSCEFSYSDKYGHKIHVLEIDKDQEDILRNLAGFSAPKAPSCE